jgi:hypothetical protein
VLQEGVAIVVLLGGLVFAVQGSAWTANGAPVGPFASIQHTPVMASDGAGGAFVVWEDWRAGNNTHTFVQHLSPRGATSPGWPGEGLMLASGGYRDHPVVIADGAGGAYVADDGTATFGVGGFGRDRIYHVGAGALAAASWPADGLTATGEPNGIAGGVHGDYLPNLALDGAGGLFVAWTFRDRFFDNVRVIRYDPGGIVAPGWPGYGNDAAPSYLIEAPSAACADGAGGALVALQDGTEYILVTRFDAGGTKLAGWPVRVTASMDGQSAPGIVSDGAGGAIVAWQDHRDATTERTFVQHLLGNGATAPDWPVEGLALSPSASDAGVRRAANYDTTLTRFSSIAADGAGGAYVAWTDISGGPGSGDIRLQHLAGNGSIPAGWPSGGLAICTARFDQSLPTVAADGVGGVFVAWQDRRSAADYDVYAQHLGSGGAIEPGWANDGNAICVAGGDQLAPVVVATGDATRAIVAWADGRGAYPNIYAAQAEPSPPVSVAQLAGTFADLAISPNPVSERLAVTFTLTKSGRATITVLDLSGRVIVAHALEAPQPGRQGFEMDSKGLPPGLYLVRLSQRNVSRVVRVCVVR